VSGSPRRSGPPRRRPRCWPASTSSARRAIVTADRPGIGVETARALAGAGAEVTLAVRDISAGVRVAGDIAATTGDGQVVVTPLDLADQGSVAAFAAAWSGPLHILVDNAGIMATPLRRTPEGWELQFATNHLGHFALANRLHDAIARRRRPDRVGQLGRATSTATWTSTTSTRERAFTTRVSPTGSRRRRTCCSRWSARLWAADGNTANALNPAHHRHRG